MRKGVSFVELLVVIAIISLVAALILVPLYRARQRLSLELAADQVLSLIEEARNLTLSGHQDSFWSVHFESSRAVLFRGQSFAEAEADNKEIKLDERVEISSISLSGGGSDVIFKRLSGSTDQDGTITLRLKRDVSQTRVISINKSGLSELED